MQPLGHFVAATEFRESYENILKNLVYAAERKHSEVPGCETHRLKVCLFVFVFLTRKGR